MRAGTKYVTFEGIVVTAEMTGVVRFSVVPARDERTGSVNVMTTDVLLEIPPTPVRDDAEAERVEDRDDVDDRGGDDGTEALVRDVLDVLWTDEVCDDRLEDDRGVLRLELCDEDVDDEREDEREDVTTTMMGREDETRDEVVELLEGSRAEDDAELCTPHCVLLVHALMPLPGTIVHV